MSQPRLAELVGTTQNQIYRLENPATSKPTITTLKKLAAAFDVALVVRFEPFSKLISWVSASEYQEVGLSAHAMAVPSFSQELSVPLGHVPNSINVSAQTRSIEIGILDDLKKKVGHSAIEETYAEQPAA